MLEVILCVVVGIIGLLVFIGLLYMCALSTLSECKTPEEVDKYFDMLLKSNVMPSWQGNPFQIWP